MGRVRSPSRLLKVRNPRGHLRAEQDADRAHEPQPPNGEYLEDEDPPEGLTPKERVQWLKLRDEMPEKVACAFDRESLHRAAILGAALKTHEHKYNLGMHRQYMLILTQFGMTPASRSTVKQHNGNGEDKNPFDEI